MFCHHPSTVFFLHRVLFIVKAETPFGGNNHNRGRIQHDEFFPSRPHYFEKNMSCEALADKNPEKYRQYLNMFMKFKTDHYPKASMNTALTEYAKYLRENNQTVATVRTYISAILHYFENENIPLDPTTQKGLSSTLVSKTGMKSPSSRQSSRMIKPKTRLFRKLFRERSDLLVWIRQNHFRR